MRPPRFVRIDSTKTSQETQSARWKPAIPTDGDVAVDVGRPSLGHSGSKLGIAEAGHARRDARDQKRQDHRRARNVTGDRTREDVDADSKGGADSQRRQVEGGQALVQLGPSARSKLLEPEEPVANSGEKHSLVESWKVWFS